MARDLEEHGEQVTTALLQCMLSREREKCVAEEIWVEDLAREAADIFDGGEDEMNRE